MRGRVLLLVSTIEALLVLGIVYFEPSCHVRGRLHGEAFFDGKSTSWWRQELEQWEMHGFGQRGSLYTREPTWFEQQRDRWRSRTPGTTDTLEELVARLQGPKLLQGDQAAEPVLRALADDSSPTVRKLARHGLGILEEDEPALGW